jgi:transcription elongation factor GreA
MTQDAFERLTVELAEYDQVTLPALTEEVISARTDSLSPIESQALMTAVMELHQTESRASRLRDMLSRAEIVQTATGSRVGVGSIVTVEEADGDVFQVMLGGQHERSRLAGVATASVQSPLGAAVLGATVNDVVTWRTPDGEQVTATVTSVD